jgi:hypothetical protein
MAPRCPAQNRTWSGTSGSGVRGASPGSPARSAEDDVDDDGPPDEDADDPERDRAGVVDDWPSEIASPIRGGRRRGQERRELPDRVERVEGRLRQPDAPGVEDSPATTVAMMPIRGLVGDGTFRPGRGDRQLDG